MTPDILILRPRPGAEETATRARELGLTAVATPLFVVEPLEWPPPDPAGQDAVMLTSANAPRLAGAAMAPFLRLPCYAVGEATARAAREAGFLDVEAGPADAAALMEMLVSDDRKRVFHPSGKDRIAVSDARVELTQVPVYASRALDRLPRDAEAALDAGALVLLHSPRAADHFGRLTEGRHAAIGIAAISAATAAAAGDGWKSVSVAPRPRDEALLELAAKLCQTGRDDR